MSVTSSAPLVSSGLPRILVGLVVCLCVSFASNMATAEAQPVIRFGVRVLQASNPAGFDTSQSPGGTPEAEVDTRLQWIVPRLKTLFRYSQYTTVGRHRIEGPLGTLQRFELPGDHWLEVTPNEIQNRSVQMYVRLLKRDRVEVTATLLAAPGAPAVIGGPAYGNGVLIIILWANPDPGQKDPGSN